MTVQAEYLPVALASYAAAAIAQAPAGPTGWKAFVMAMSGFIIPFAVVMHPGSLVTGVVDVADAIWGFFNVFTAFIPLGAAITDYLFRNLANAGEHTSPWSASRTSCRAYSFPQSLLRPWPCRAI